MTKDDLPFVNLKGYNFNYLRCGTCCKVLVKTRFNKKLLLVSYK